MRVIASCAVIVLAAVLLLPAYESVAEEGGGKSLSKAPASTRTMVREKSITSKAISRVLRGTLDDSDLALDDGSWAESWGWSGTQGEQLTVRMESKAFDPYLVLLRQVGEAMEPVAEDDNGGGGTTALLDVTLPARGQYFVIATTAAPRTGGAYVLKVTSAPAGEATTQPVKIVDGGGAIEVGKTVTAKITGDDRRLDDGSHCDIWVVSAREGQVLTLQMVSEAFRPWVAFADEQGQLLIQRASDQGSYTTLSFEFPRTATYALLTGTALPGASGEYTVLLTEDRPKATPLTDLQKRYPGGGNPDDTYALLVGIDDYPGVQNDLNSCVADVKLWKDLLVDQYGVRPENVVTITDSDATGEHLVTAFLRHLGQAGPKGAAVFVYSGHGVQLDQNVEPKDAEADGLDESIAVWAAPPKGSLITDDQIGALISRLKTRRVVVVMDSCNSGTGTRGPKDRIKEMKYKDIQDAYDVYDGGGEKGLAKGGAEQQPTGHVLLASCKPNETSVAWPGQAWPDVGVASVFTYFLVAHLRAAGDDVSFEDAMRKVQPRVMNFTKNLRGTPQTPQVEGKAAKTSIAEYLR